MSAVTNVTTPVPREVWREVLATDPGATIYQTPEWFDATRSGTRAVDVSRLYLLEDGRHVVLPLLRRSLLPGLTFDDGYPPTWGYGDLIASGGVRGSDVRMVLAQLQQQGNATRVRINANYVNAEQWEAGARGSGVITVPRTVHVLDLEGGFGRVWKERFHSSARRAVRKAEAAGLEVHRDTSGRLTPDFRSTYSEWTDRRAQEARIPSWLARRIGRRRNPLAKIEAVVGHLGVACRQWIARLDGEPVAALLSLVHGDHAVYWRGYSHKALAGPVRANNLLQKLAIEDACDVGCRSYSMGQSGGAASLERFKETLGATPRPAVEYRIERLPITRLESFAHRLEADIAQLLRSRIGREAAPGGAASEATAAQGADRM